MKTLKTFWFILLLSLFFSTGLYGQNEANFWYFGNKCGLDFNSGEPVVMHDGQTVYNSGHATFSDSTGELVLYTDLWRVYNKYHNTMINGTMIPDGGWSGNAIVKWPSKNDLYFIVTGTYSNFNDYNGFYYSIVDVTANAGQGAVIEEVYVDAGWDAADRVAIVKKEDSEGIWVVTRKFDEDAFAAFLIDENGFNTDPVISAMPDRINSSGGSWGYIKISYDKKYLVSSYQEDGELEVCRFHACDGSVEYLYTHKPGGAIHGLEFSPDSKYFYYSGNISNDPTEEWIYQLDMQFIENETLFYNSAIAIGSYAPGGPLGIQLARDGKIYLTGEPEKDGVKNYFLNVIHNPWIRGIGCDYEMHALYMAPGYNPSSLPNILLDYLYRFEWEADNYCLGTSVKFEPNFIPTPQTIQWNFDDGPGSTSWQLSPTYTFKNPGVHEVKVDVWYPSGRYEHTSREIEIMLSPQPDLGPDTLICEGASITLNAGCEADFFSWSTGQFGISSITVSDSGIYWVKGRFSDSGCEGYDTIHIGYHQPTIIDETNLVIIPTTCNGASGSISGLTALGSPPYTYQWLDLSGNTFGTNIDASGLPAGQYYLTITDGSGCETVSDVYTIEDAGNLQVLEVEITQPHCGRPDGQIIVHGLSPSGSALEFSVDDGTNYSSDSIFFGLYAGMYVVRIRDINGCEGFYFDNPISLQDIPGPQVQPPVITDETDFLGNGSIELTATGSTTTLYYSNDNGDTYQSNNGAFNNLAAGTYICIVKDENDCDTIFTVEIQNIILTFLHAITGEGGHCLGNTAMIPVNVDNFNAVATFHLKLSYNADNLQCEGFTNVHPQLLDSLTGWVDQAAGIINLAWNSPSPVTFTQPETVAELVFTTKNPGQGELAWYTGTTESYFTNAGGNPIPAEFQTGEVKVYEPPEIILDQSKTVCTGQFVSIMGIALGNQPPIDYQWIYPDGDTTSNDPFFFSVTQADAGLYTLLATDHVGCTDQKSIELFVSENPVAAFHGTDTLEMHTGDVLDAGTGLSSYRWNTGDSTESIVINAEGMYSVEMESPVGCLGSDSVYVKLTSEEIPEFNLYVPNAFTPDGDGVNDTFLALYNGNDISHFTMEVYDRWGGRIFRSENILLGWDGKKNGKDCPGGVYVYKIVFSVDGVTGNQERVGTVMLVK